MNKKQASQLQQGEVIHISGFFNYSVEATFVKFENDLVFVNTQGTELDNRRAQIDIDAKVHQISVFPKYVHFDETERSRKKTSFDRGIYGSRKF